MHRNDLMNPDLLSKIVLLTYADVLCRPCGARLGKFPRTRKAEEWLRWGLTNQEIASRLKPSEHTVKNHVHRILRKTKANSIASRSRNTATGETAHPSPIYPLHCDALPRAEAAETH